MRKASALYQHNRYARMLGVVKASELLQTALVEEEESLNSFSVEAEDRAVFDDLVERRVTASGEVIEGWQIKEQWSHLTADEFRPILKALADQTDLARGHFAVPTSLEVTGVGSLRVLKSLCKRCAAPGALTAILVNGATKKERKWLDFARDIMGNDVGAVHLLSRLSVEFIGDGEQVRDRARDILSRVVTQPTSSILNALEALLSSVDGASSIDADVVLSHLVDLKDQFRPLLSASSRRSNRAGYLEGAERLFVDARALGALPGTGVDLYGSLADVFVSRQLISNEAEIRRLDQWIASGSSSKYVVRGEVGSGKSSLMLQTLHVLCQRALSDKEAPLPLLLRASTLQASNPIQAVAESIGIGAASLSSLLGDTLLSWVVLVDGADELPHAWPMIEKFLDGEMFNARVESVVVSTRPVARVELSGYRPLQLRSWGDAELDEFLDRWRAGEPTAVRALTEAKHYESVRQTLLSNPLMATLCLLLAKEKGDVPTSRSRVFMEVTELVFEGWRHGRSRPPVSWHELLPVLADLAYRQLESEAGIAIGELRDAIRCAGINPVLDSTDEAERQLGILSRRSDGYYEFVQRSFAEYLAAHHACARRCEPVSALAYRAWAEEVVRHMLGILELADPAAAETELLGLVRPLEDGLQGDGAPHLRALQIAIRAAHDIQDLSPTTVFKVAQVASRMLREEESAWLGTRVAEELRVHAATNSTVWRAVVERLEPSLHSNCSLLSWHLAHPPENDDACWLLLRHRDPGVRSLGLERLSPSAIVSGADDLMRILFDQALGVWGDSRAPAIASATRLRQLTSADKSRLLPLLNRLVTEGGQLLSGAAAIALKPEEGKVEHLVPALRDLSQGYNFPPEVLEDLESTEIGIDALKAMWPDWRGANSSQLPAIHGAEQAEHQEKPVSAEVIARFASCCEYSARTSDFELLLHVRSAARDVALCRGIARGRLGLVKEGSLRNLAQEAQLILGTAAARDRVVRDILLREWSTVSGDTKLYESFPGLSLEALVVEDDGAAIEAYATWLPEAFHAFQHRRGLPDPRLFANRRVRELVDKHTHMYVAWVNDGRVGRDGSRSRLAVSAALGWLRFSRPLWEQNLSVLDEIRIWLEKDDSNDYRGALHCLDGASLPGDLVEAVVKEVVQKIQQFRSGMKHRFRFEAQASLRWLNTNGLAGHPLVQALIHQVVDDNTSLAVTARCMQLAKIEPRAARDLSEGIADRAIVYSEEDMRDSELDLLVSCAPEAWAHALESVLTRYLYPSPSIFLRVLKVLPAGLREGIARRVYQQVSQWEVPWWHNDSREQLGRPSDLLNMVLHDEGADLRSLNRVDARHVGRTAGNLVDR